ncbi:hypothetical protein V6N13_050021 [Hibiscus sabdariffa]|uniref:Protein kinase domain-containing protein n=1 Tax=Hibiscus sabdariffa TaxID=183260 RepID=A0ABR2QW38_9ROSI
MPLLRRASKTVIVSYLRKGCHRRIIRKDIKPANVFCLPRTSTLRCVIPNPPEFFVHGLVNEMNRRLCSRSRALELITGMQALDSPASRVFPMIQLHHTNSCRQIL